MFLKRIGTFLFMVGLLLIGLYVISDAAKTPVCNYLLFGVVLAGIGIALWVRNPGAPPPPSGRFRLLRARQKKQNKGNK